MEVTIKVNLSDINLGTLEHAEALQFISEIDSSQYSTEFTEDAILKLFEILVSVYSRNEKEGFIQKLRLL